MRKTIWTWLAALVVCVSPGLAHAVDNCAFEDLNDNQVFDGADVIVPNALWIGGAAFVTANPFVVPVGCDNVLAAGPAVTNGVRVTAAKISFFGRLEYLPAGGRGIVMIATGDLNVGNGINQAVIKAGGHNVLPANSVALYRRSVALGGGGECRFNFAEILGVSPVQDTQVGILCSGDLSFVATSVIGSRVNIQSLTGEIDGSGQGGGGGGALLSLASLCDNPATNLTGGGNHNGIIDAPDFPCSLALPGIADFANASELASACTPFSVLGNSNRFHAFNDPLVMITGAGQGNPLNLQDASVVGRYRVTLAAEDSNILTQNAKIDHGEQLGLTAPGGARIWLFADPTSVVRLPVDREDFFGPSAGVTNVDGACYQSPNNVNVGQDAGGVAQLLGTPAAAPCKQLNQFVPVLNGTF